MLLISFDYQKLNKKDQKYYDAMTDSERQNFERIWVNIETQKLRLMQQKNASKERANREKRSLAEKERKARNHRLIERGAILESCIIDPIELSNEQLREIVTRVFQSESVRQYIESIRHRPNDNFS